MKLQQAAALADRLGERMRPFCVRVEIAGSIRRGRDEVKDIEIVAVPRWEERTPSGELFPDTCNVLFEDWATRCSSEVTWIKPGTSELIEWKPQPCGRYWRGLVLPESVKLDLFLASPENFGLIYLIRTGSAEFSEAVVTHARRIGKPCREGYLRADHGVNETIPTPEEADVFRVLGLKWTDPGKRSGADAVRPWRDSR